MSLISNTDYLIHSLRMNYLRNVEDPYGPRMISLDPSYNTNQHILASSMADVDRWPELAMPSSPPVSDTEGDNNDGESAGTARGRGGGGGNRDRDGYRDRDGEPNFGATGLRHTQTIMGGRTGGLGLRVDGKRYSSSKRLSGSGSTPRNPTRRMLRVKEDLEDPNLNALPPPPKLVVGPSSGDEGEGINVKVQGPTVVEDAPVQKTVQFIPKFKNAAEMEARRRVRMMARRGNGTSSGATQSGSQTTPAPPPPPPQPLRWDTTSEEEESSSDEELSDDGQASMDDGDEFDPEFAATRTPGVASTSLNHVLSPVSDSQHSRPRARQSPTTSQRPQAAGGGGVVTPNAPTTPNGGGTTSKGMTRSNSTRSTTGTPSGPHSSSNNPNPSSTSSITVPAPPLFPRRPVPPLPASTHPSLLTTLLASHSLSSTSNPFTATYGAISGHTSPPHLTTNVKVYFPLARKPAGKAMELNVRRDATFEEVIGFGLWTYWEEGWLPRLDEGLSAEEGNGEGGDEERERERGERLSAVGWVMRIAEDDGEVDDEWPPPDRTAKIAKFNFDAYAVLEANPAQIQQNHVLESKIQRRPSRTMKSKPDPTTTSSSKLAVPGATGAAAGGTGAGAMTAANMAAAGSAPGPTFSGLLGSTMIGGGGSMPLSTSLGPSLGQGPPMFLRIRVAETADAVHVSTTIEASAGMYMQEVLESVCRKRKMSNWKEYALLLRDANILIPLDRTVASLQGNRELVLVKRSMLDGVIGGLVKSTGKTTDPNASIFKRMSDVPKGGPGGAYGGGVGGFLDYTATYKRYTIYRKMPMLVARQEKTLAIDGVYIHIMPPPNRARAVFDSGKTYSYHIKSIADCEQSAKSSCIFKIVLHRAANAVNVGAGGAGGVVGGAGGGGGAGVGGVGGGGPTGIKALKRRYDFEADSPRLAAEIVQEIKNLKSSFDKYGTFKNSKRRTQVGGVS